MLWSSNSTPPSCGWRRELRRSWAQTTLQLPDNEGRLEAFQRDGYKQHDQHEPALLQVHRSGKQDLTWNFEPLTEWRRVAAQADRVRATRARPSCDTPVIRL